MNLFIKKISKIISDTVIKTQTFGISYGFYTFLWYVGWYISPISKLRQFAEEKKYAFIEKYIKKHYCGLIKKYATKKWEERILVDADNYPFWMFWWQGENEMPELVRICYQSQKMACGKNHHLITRDNLSQFLQLPEAVMVAFKEGRILFAHFSDIIRVSLISKYGGCWIDATCYCPSTMPEEYKLLPYYSSRINSDLCHGVSYCMGAGVIDNFISSFVRDIFYEYCKKEIVWIDYLFLDNLLEFALRNFDRAKTLFSTIPINTAKRANLFPMLSEKYDEKKFVELCQDNWMFKLSYKKMYPKMIDGIFTLYGFLCNRYNNS